MVAGFNITGDVNFKAYPSTVRQYDWKSLAAKQADHDNGSDSINFRTKASLKSREEFRNKFHKH